MNNPILAHKLVQAGIQSPFHPIAGQIARQTHGLAKWFYKPPTRPEATKVV